MTKGREGGENVFLYPNLEREARLKQERLDASTPPWELAAATPGSTNLLWDPELAEARKACEEVYCIVGMARRNPAMGRALQVVDELCTYVGGRRQSNYGDTDLISRIAQLVYEYQDPQELEKVLFTDVWESDPVKHGWVTDPEYSEPYTQAMLIIYDERYRVFDAQRSPSNDGLAA